MGYIRMSDLVGAAPQSSMNPIAIYDGPRVGDEFREWNAAMSGLAGRKGRRWAAAGAGGESDEEDAAVMSGLAGRKSRRWAAAAAPGGVPMPPPGDDEEDAFMGQAKFVDPPQDLDILYSMNDWGDGDASMELSPEAAFGISGLGQLPGLGVAQRIAGEAIQAIEFRSQVTPQVVIDRPFAAGGAPPPQVQGGTPISRVFMEKIAKPAVYLRLAGGAVVPMEPYGRPTEDYTGLMILGSVALTAAGVFAGVKIAQKFFCKK